MALDHLAEEWVDRADRVDLVAEPLDAQRRALPRGEEIDDAAADRELTGHLQTRDALKAALLQPALKLVLIQLLPDIQSPSSRRDLCMRRHGLNQRGNRCYQHARRLLRGELTQDAQSFAKDGLDTTLVYQRNGTIQFKDAVWNGLLGDAWDMSRWDRYAWDEDNSEVVESILRALREDLFVGDELGYFNLFFFDMVKESLRQVPNADWLIKTTYLDINQQSTNDLKPVAHYYDRRDILVRDYLNEVKPYHSKISDLNQSLTSRENLTVEIEEFLSLGFSQREYDALDEAGNELTDENGNTLVLLVSDTETTPQYGV